jgi:hypothetical protein
MDKLLLSFDFDYEYLRELATSNDFNYESIVAYLNYYVRRFGLKHPYSFNIFFFGILFFIKNKKEDLSILNSLSSIFIDLLEKNSFNKDFYIKKFSDDKIHLFILYRDRKLRGSDIYKLYCGYALYYEGMKTFKNINNSLFMENYCRFFHSKNKEFIPYSLRTIFSHQYISRDDFIKLSLLIKLKDNLIKSLGCASPLLGVGLIYLLKKDYFEAEKISKKFLIGSATLVSAGLFLRSFIFPTKNKEQNIFLQNKNRERESNLLF